MAECIYRRRDDATKVGQMMGDIVYTRPSRVDLTKRKQAIRQRLGDVGGMII